jgi:TonB-linked SusC/RagA family outer membrane protein
MRLNTKWIYALLLVLSIQFSFAQEKDVSGVVTDNSGPVLGVNVSVRGTNRNAQTDLNGRYSIKATKGEVLVFSFIGMVEVSKTVGDSNILDVKMKEGIDLNEVIVVGYSTSTNKAFTGTVKQIKAEVLARKSVTDLSQALAGEIAGVRVIVGSGQPGSSATIRIRGIGSVNGNRDPLYILDGVPYSGNVSAINFADIESTTVLKDASATAIYGSRGANGVIIITTKNGRSSNSFILVETKLGNNLSLLPRYNTIKSPEEYIGLSWESIRNQGAITGSVDPVVYANTRLFGSDGIHPKYNMWNVANATELIDPATGKVQSNVTRKYTPEDWGDYAFQASIRSETNLTMGGGEGKSSYFTSFGYLEDKGYSINSDYKRVSTRININNQIRSWLKGAMNMGYSYSKSNNNGQLIDDAENIFAFVDNIPSIYPLFERDATGAIKQDPIYGGGLYDYGIGRGFGSRINGISEANREVNKTGRHELNANVFFDVKLMEELNLETRFGSQYYNSATDLKADSFYGAAAEQSGKISKSKTENLAYSFLNLLRFKKNFGSHAFEVLVAHENNRVTTSYLTASKYRLFDSNSVELDNAVVTIPSTSYTDENSIESYFGQVNYALKKTYFVSATVRTDGSSRFITNKWGTFGSVGASWIVSNESFMQNQKVFRSLKLKSSYGIIGEQGGIGSYPGLDLFTVSNLNDQISVAFKTKGNPDLTWEKSKMFQVGAEFSLGKYIDASVDYYSKVTDDLIFDRRVGPSLGYSKIKVNDGVLVNKGIEFDVTSHLLKGNDYFIDFSVNGELLKNKLKKMPIDPSTGSEKTLDIDDFYGRSSGHSLYDFYVREWSGVNPLTGAAQWKAYFYDENKNGIQDASEEFITSLYEYEVTNPNNVSGIVETKTDQYYYAGMKYVGKSAVPKVRGAFTLSTGYKGFSFSTQFLYSLGGYAYDGVYGNLMHSNKIGSNNWSTDILNRWTKPGDITDVPRLSNGQDGLPNGFSSRFIVKSDYLSLNNVRVGYTLAGNYMKKVKMESLDFWISGDNLMLFSARAGFNPSTSESGQSSTYNYAPMSTISLGVRAKF